MRENMYVDILGPASRISLMQDSRCRSAKVIIFCACKVVKEELLMTSRNSTLTTLGNIKDTACSVRQMKFSRRGQCLLIRAVRAVGSRSASPKPISFICYARLCVW